jgi:putative ATP-dependent endonuclease of OLD family
LQLRGEEIEGLQRFLDSTRAEILFSRGVIFVEGDAEAALLPVLAQSCGHDLDELGVTVCNVGGVNFSPYVKLAQPWPFHSLLSPIGILPGPRPPLGRKRVLDLLNDVRQTKGKSQ